MPRHAVRSRRRATCGNHLHVRSQYIPRMERSRTMELTWSDERMSMAQKIVMERFALDSVAGHLAPHSTVDEMETTVRRNRFDFTNAIVIDREILELNEPFSF